MAVSVALVGCLQPVGEAGPVQVSACVGSCPSGECDDWCAARVDAGPCVPEECLARLACSPAPASCTAYSAAAFRPTSGPPPTCAQSPGSYCVRGIGADGAGIDVAVQCTDAGVTSAVCSGINPCDAGAMPSICRAVCGPVYCTE
jgi:hypothetical protein